MAKLYFCLFLLHYFEIAVLFILVECLCVWIKLIFSLISYLQLFIQLKNDILVSIKIVLKSVKYIYSVIVSLMISKVLDICFNSILQDLNLCILFMHVLRLKVHTIIGIKLNVWDIWTVYHLFMIY